MFPVIAGYIKDMFGIADESDPVIMLAADTLLASIFRWLLSGSDVMPDAFVNGLKESILKLSKEWIRHLI